MTKAKKIASLFLFMFIATSVGVYAQVPAQQQQQQTQVDVSDEDLNKFADAYQEVQMENQKAQQEMMNVIQEEGMEVERFNEIQQASMDPNAEVDATADEKAKHEKVVAQIEEMQPKLEKKMESVIKDKGMSMEKYQQVAAALQNDQELQQKLQGIMMKQQGGGQQQGQPQGQPQQPRQ